MTKAEWELRERTLTLFSTGKYDSKSAARDEAKRQLANEARKRSEAKPPQVEASNAFSDTWGH